MANRGLRIGFPVGFTLRANNGIYALMGSVVSDFITWATLRDSRLAGELASLNASNPVIVDASLGHTHTELTAAIITGYTNNRPVKIIGQIDISAGTGGASSYAPKTGGQKVIIFADMQQGGVSGTKFWEMDTGYHLVGLNLTNNNGGSLRPRNGANIRDFGALGCRFAGGGFGYKEESGSGNTRTNIYFHWNEFVGPSIASTNDIFLFGAEFPSITNNWFRAGAADKRRFLRYGCFGVELGFNIFEDGFTGQTFLSQNGATSSSSPYRFPHQQSPIGDKIYGNLIRNILEESLSYDSQANSVNGHTCIGMGIIASKDTSGGQWKLTFNTKLNGTTNDGIGGAQGLGNSDTDNTLLYRNPVGKYIQIASGSLAGKVAMIGDVSIVSPDVGAITLTIPNAPSGINALRSTTSGVGYRIPINPAELTQQDFTALSVGTMFFVGDIAYNNEIAWNTIEVYGAANRNTKGVAIWGMGSGLDLHDNRFVDLGSDPTNLSKGGIIVSIVAGVARKNDAHTAPIGGIEKAQFLPGYCKVHNNDLGGLILGFNSATYSLAANLAPVTLQATIANNRNCAGGGPQISNWVDQNGTELAGPIPTFNTDTTNVYGNS